MIKLKYPKELYIGSGFFCEDMDCEYTNRFEKLVKCRKSHKCAYCQKQINIGDYAIEDKALFPKEGWKSCYICVRCIEEWLEETGQAERRNE